MYDSKHTRTAELPFKHVTNPVDINFISPGSKWNTGVLSTAFIYTFIHITHHVFFFFRKYNISDVYELILLRFLEDLFSTTI